MPVLLGVTVDHVGGSVPLRLGVTVGHVGGQCQCCYVLQ